MNIVTIEFVEKIESYCSGEMTPKEKIAFEKYIQKDAFIFNTFIEYKELFKYLQLQKNQEKLTTHIKNNPKLKFKVEKKFLTLRYNIYKRRVALLAIAGIFVFVVLVAYIFNTIFYHSNQLVELKRNFATTINKLETKINIDKNQDIKIDNIGTGFLIDNDGFLITSSHILKGSKRIYVENIEGNYFNVEVININEDIDIALLKIVDSSFSASEPIPFKFTDKNLNLGENIFSLGYPKEEIVYSEGYLSSLTGYNSDKNTLQMNISLNPGNSGGPIFNTNGNIIGVIKNKRVDTDVISYAVKSDLILSYLKQLKYNDIEKKLKKLQLQSGNYESLKQNKIDRIKKYKKFIYLVKSYS